jgi:hypothetical protein
MNILISIGNSDDKLTQREWVNYINDIRDALKEREELGLLIIHGEWFSAPDSPWQNANWCVEAAVHANQHLNGLRAALTMIRKLYRQDSIAWTQGPVELI